MGEDRPRGEPPTHHERLTVKQAAATLGITEGAVRSRIKRGTLPTTKEGGSVFVLLGGGTSQANQTPNTGIPADHTQELIATLREQLEAERQAHAEARRIIAGLVERLPPALEPPGGPTEATEGTSGSTGREAAQEGSHERPWWRRVFGGG